MYTDDSIITWGKYKFTAIKRIPASWLLGKHKNKGIHDTALVEYVAANLEALKARQTAEQTGNKTAPVELPCTKIVYVSESEAKKHLHWIEDHAKTDTVPSRAYECDKCGFWHLTSKPIF